MKKIIFIKKNLIVLCWVFIPYSEFPNNIQEVGVELLRQLMFKKDNVA